MGTPEFSVNALEALIQAGHHILLVVTQPDKQKGRGKEVQYSPVKECALRHNLPVYQPVKIKTAESVEYLKTFQADAYIVAAFGQLLSKEILEIPKYGCINIHASLLPKYRGAAPIQWAVINGEKESGITIMQMDVGLDTGDMLLKGAVSLDEEETADSLHDKLKDLGATLIVQALQLLEEAKLERTPQPEITNDYAKMLTKSMGEMDFAETALELERKVRGFNSWPSAYTFFREKTLKIWKTKALPLSSDVETNYEPGTIVHVGKDYLDVLCKDGILRILELQLEGKKRMLVKDFLLGVAVQVGDSFGKQKGGV